MIYKLILENQADGLARSRWTFKPPAIVGRDPGCDVCIDHDSISRSHCQFMLNMEEALVVKDLESRNGTYVDDTRVHQAILMAGQIIQIGALRLKVEFSTEDEHARAQTAKPPSGSLYATQPMKTLRPTTPAPAAQPVRSWWQRIFGD